MQIPIKIHNFLAYMLLERWYIYLAIFIFLIIIGLLLKIYFKQILGLLAERTVKKYLSELDSKKYKTINDLMVKANGYTAQIDHLVVSNFGIFIIEAKNYYGWITGNDYSDNWILTKPKKYKKKIINPIKQNYSHMKVLKFILRDYPDLVYYPIVVFTKRSGLKVNTMPDVIYNSDLIRTIKKYGVEIITDEVRDKIYKELKDLNIKDRKLRKEHVIRIQEKINDYNNKINSNICPKCAGNLIVKNGKYGKFKGCSNYPKCGFTISINQAKYSKD